jgi:hypothetical protein
MKCRGMSVRSSTRCVVLQRKCNRTNAGSDRSFQFCAWPFVADAFVEDLLQVLAAALGPERTGRSGWLMSAIRGTPEKICSF